MPDFPIGQGTPLGYQQLLTYSANVITAASWASTNGGQVTFTTTTSHSVTVGATFTISGMTPSGYNGSFVAITGTTGSTLVAALATDPGTATVMGTLVASLSASTALSPPAGATSVLIQATTAAIRFRDDGVVPSATVGFPLAVSTPIVYAGNVRNLRLFAQTGSPVVDLLYYR